MDNYSAWQIDPAEHSRSTGRSELLSLLLRYAVLAPSSHNTQPWRFRTSDDVIEVLPDLRRRLPVADTRDTQLYASLGCSIEAIVVAADAFGLSVDVQYRAGPPAYAKLGLRGTGNATPRASHLVHCIPRRCTNRTDHRLQVLPEPVADILRGASDDHAQVHLLTDAARCASIADLVVESIEYASSKQAFFRELADWVLPNGSRSPLGMPGSTLGMSDWQAWLLPKLMRWIAPPGMSAAARTRYRAHTASYAIVSTAGDTAPDWMAAGRVFMRVALLAEQAGLATNNLAGPIGVASLQSRLKATIGTAGIPQICTRVGYATKSMPHSPRLTAADVTESTSPDRTQRLRATPAKPGSAGRFRGGSRT
jgi:hypothetical protein